MQFDNLEVFQLKVVTEACARRAGSRPAAL